MGDEERGRSRYRTLRENHPELFQDDPDAAVELLLAPEDVAAAESAMAERLAAAGLPTAWARTGVVFEDQYGMTLREAVRLPDGRLGTHLRRFNPGNAAGVVVLPVLGGQVLLVRHYRHPTRRWHLEAPRGLGTPGAGPEQDARRELFEEIGAHADRLVDLGGVYPDSGVSGTEVRLFYADVAGHGAVEVAEGISEVLPVAPDELAGMIGSGELTDGFTICAYTRAVLRGMLPGPPPPPR